MSIDFGNTELTELTPKISVIGVGGAGCNAVNNMIAAQLQGVDFVVANTDAQALANAAADNRIQLGVEITQGLGAGAQPKIGEAAAEEAVDTIDNILNGCHMAFITAGMGGGTGTGAAPVIARRAREKGILTVGVVTKPFQFEGGRRMKIAEAGIQELASHVDTLIIIPNQNLFRVANERTTFADAFNMADEVLHSGVRGITDLMVMPGLINLDFADVRTVMSEMGKAMMGTGEAEGETRARDAAAAAISNPLLEEASLKGAKGVIINVTGGMDMTLYEVDEAVNMVRDQVDPDALIVFGSAFNQDLEGRLRVSVVATGIEGGAGNVQMPMPRREKIETPSVSEKRAQKEEPKFEVPLAAAADIAEGTDAGADAEMSDDEHTDKAEDLMTAMAALQDAIGTPDEDQTEPEQADAFEEESTKTAPVETAEDDLEARAVAAKGGDSFIADAPMTPKANQTPLNEANPFQEAAYASGSPEKQAETAHGEGDHADAQPQKRSLFQLMTAGLRSGETEAPVVRQTPSNDSGAVKKEPTLGGVTPEERPAVAPSKDQLEIPSFLKRQQN
ncbi:cell division protein FtsZ [Kordiimonas aestuarii]|uniref:cell division protein FtsZ n=1 Tax=Kordiimonas aestuarii TaxID=1005925 RepID=UPI0021CEBE43|nr:cell division protein FtsZ [Kordiimonas aestuarii]